MAILTAKDLCKSFNAGAKKIEAVKNVSLSVEKGEILAFLGPNGAGKSTTIKMIAGLVKPDQGSVSIDGLDPHKNHAAFSHIGAVLEGSRNLYNQLNCTFNLEYFAGIRGVPASVASRRAATLLDRFGLKSKAKEKAGDLSRGMQQKLALAISLIHDPQVLLLDEPTLGLDVEATEAVKVHLQELAGEGKAIILTTHQLDIAQAVADRVAIIHNGTLIACDKTKNLIDTFCSKSYSLKYEGILSDEQASKLRDLGVAIEGNELTFAGQTELLHQVLPCLQPLFINSINIGDANLSSIFLKLVKEQPNV